MKKLIFLIASLTTLIFAQQKPIVEEIFETVLLKNVNIVFSSDNILKDGMVLIEDGFIKEIGKDLTLRRNSFVVDGNNYYLYPGLIDATFLHSHKIPKPRDTVAFTPGTAPNFIAGIQPEIESRLFIDGNFKKHHEFGFTNALFSFDGGLISGQPTFLDLHSKENQILLSHFGILYRFKNTNRVYPSALIGMMAKIRQLFYDAKYYGERKENFFRDNSQPKVEFDETSEILLKVLSKEIPVMFEAQTANQIRRALQLKKEFNFELILLGADEAFKVIDEIKSANVPLILSLDFPQKPLDKITTDTLKYFSKDYSSYFIKEEVSHLRKRQEEVRLNLLSNPKILKSNNIPFTFGSFKTNLDTAKINLRLLLKHGMSEDDLFKALTTSAATIFNLDGKIGKLEAGYFANFILTDLPFFQEKSKVKMLFINGRKYEIE